MSINKRPSTVSLGAKSTASSTSSNDSLTRKSAPAWVCSTCRQHGLTFEIEPKESIVPHSWSIPSSSTSSSAGSGSHSLNQPASQRHATDNLAADIRSTMKLPTNMRDVGRKFARDIRTSSNNAHRTFGSLSVLKPELHAELVVGPPKQQRGTRLQKPVHMWPKINQQIAAARMANQNAALQRVCAICG